MQVTPIRPTGFLTGFLVLDTPDPCEDESPGIEIKSMTQKVKGLATIRIAAFYFLASAVFEVMDFNSAVALFGDVRTGAVAVVYHFVFTAFYGLSGIGMWTAKPWDDDFFTERFHNPVPISKRPDDPLLLPPAPVPVPEHPGDCLLPVFMTA